MTCLIWAVLIQTRHENFVEPTKVDTLFTAQDGTHSKAVLRSKSKIIHISALYTKSQG